MGLMLEGLDLLGTRPAPQDGAPMRLPVDTIDEDPGQPRFEFDDVSLQELAATIRERGVRQPISVRPQRAALPLVSAPAERAGLCSFLDRCPLRVAGVCDSKTPPRRDLEGGVEVFCHRTAAELVALQKPPESQHGCVA